MHRLNGTLLGVVVAVVVCETEARRGLARRSLGAAVKAHWQLDWQSVLQRIHPGHEIRGSPANHNRSPAA
jgi:hypothetical protein